jgi:hypothetical protein
MFSENIPSHCETVSGGGTRKTRTTGKDAARDLRGTTPEATFLRL